MASPKFHNAVRKYHRWLGFFLAGIMGIYAVSGTLLIFRKTDFLKYPQVEERQLDKGLNGKSLGKQIALKGFAVESEVDDMVVFNQGQYNKLTGEVVINKKDYPAPLAKLVKLHKATTGSPLFFLNISFGIGLLFFVVSAFLMFMPKLPMFKSGVKIAAAGAVFAILVVMFGS
ncbi:MULTISPECIES: hypothetical protein [Alteromonadaceae]|uniref:hypothetical protein n=1 Tax=Alteromonadaceae TaxID=72275 RepID=UPI001C0904D2|nr:MULTISPECIES: hypothetical protein [Aliiglaciecola]MBU2876957.1 hypothetical protein [Aliiglaciecola lipolytica]MDO6712647.1 hypothetical protein [Aliiglaciecola sp. 2_MG-2023]MDO6753745.1 hypothetical protein [Aliiglaciecola sp. 1_MG-2023]